MGLLPEVLEGHWELTDTRAREANITNASALVTQTAAPSPPGSEKLMGRDKGSSGKRDAKRGNKEEVKGDESSSSSSFLVIILLLFLQCYRRVILLFTC